MKKSVKILILDDDSDVRREFVSVLERNGCEVQACGTVSEARRRLQERTPDLVITELDLPEMEGKEIQEFFRREAAGAGLIVTTGEGSLKTVIEVLKNGALDYIAKPLDSAALLESVREAMKKKRFMDEERLITMKNSGERAEKTLLSRSTKMIDIFTQAAQVSTTEATVLIVGETGTGKELIASSIHENSNRAGRPFIPINCSALAENLLESELFGYVKGAFTGAVSDKKGVFEEAEGGTVFLDEIGEISPATQAKLLRVLEQNEIKKLGLGTPVGINARVIAATNKNLEELAANGRFRDDLFYRLGVFTINIPPLRDRMEDIPLLANHFIKRMSNNANPGEMISPYAMELLQKYHWPGNVRELENVIESSIIKCSGCRITAQDIPERIRRAAGCREDAAGNEIKISVAPSAENAMPSLEDVEKSYIKYVLDKTDGNKTAAAEIIGLARTTLHRRLNELDIERRSTRDA